MPTYKITSPDGRVLRITGDTPPNEQQLQEIFSKVQGTQAQPATQGYKSIDYSDILNNKNLTKEQKVQAMQARTQEENKRLDFEKNKKLAKMWGGEALALGSAFIPVGLGTSVALKAAAPAAKLASKVGKPIIEKAATEIVKNIPGLAVGGAVSGVGNAMVNDRTDVKDYIKSAALGAAQNLALGKAVQAGSEGIKAAINSNAVKQGVPKVLEALTSTPAEFSERALEKELTGNSILKGKFDAKTAYQPIEQKLREAKNMLPTNENFAEQYYNLGKKATEGFENLKLGAGQEISEMLGQLGDKPLDTTNIKNAISSTIKSYAKGGNINPAEIRAGKELEQVNNLIGEEAKPIDLHNIKELLYDVANYDTIGGIRNDAIKGVANQINNYLRAIEPKYAKPNDVFSLIKNVEKETGGLNPSTIGSKISNIGSKGNITSGLDNRLKDIDSLLPNGSKFYKQAQDINAEREAIENIKGMIGQQYERNPRLLANRTDEGFENAINELQNRTGVNFMDELADTRAREALEKWFPGQGGGSGSAQGFGNLLRTTIIGGSPAYALLGHNPYALAGLLYVSPKFMAKGTIKNLGKLNKMADNAYNKAIEKYINTEANIARRTLTPSNATEVENN